MGGAVLQWVKFRRVIRSLQEVKEGFEETESGLTACCASYHESIASIRNTIAEVEGMRREGIVRLEEATERKARFLEAVSRMEWDFPIDPSLPIYILYERFTDHMKQAVARFENELAEVEAARLRVRAKADELGLVITQATQVARQLRERRVLALVNVASAIAGPAYPWATEAWLGDLSVNPGGIDQPFPYFKRLCIALGFVFYTAPRMRARKTLWDLASVLIKLSLWLLYYDVATGIVLGGVHIAVVEILRPSYGTWAALFYATCAALTAGRLVGTLRRRFKARWELTNARKSE